tara:strand:+ start:682 stop:855 length:174 start_codon:yes stop_codon:yes gene_type:complete
MDKEIKKKKKVRQYRSRQGRSDRQYQSTMKAMTYGCGTFIVGLILLSIYKVITGTFL